MAVDDNLTGVEEDDRVCTPASVDVEDNNMDRASNASRAITTTTTTSSSRGSSSHAAWQRAADFDRHWHLPQHADQDNSSGLLSSGWRHNIVAEILGSAGSG